MKTSLDMDSLVFDPPGPGCVLYLPGPPGGGPVVSDRSLYGNKGLITGANWLRLPGGLWCLDFDGGDDCVDLGTGPGLDLRTDVSLEAWLYRNSDVGIGGIVNTSDSANGAQMTYSWWSNSGTFQLYVGNGTNYSSVNMTPGLATQTWGHIVVAKKGLDVTWYLNGLPRGSGSLSYSSTSLTRLTVGALKRTATTYTFNGRIARLRIYSYPVTQFEARRHFDREKHLFGVW
ncbi:MAG: hypothetical protein PHU08_03115 [Dehalococcoidales bacterium]|nr:hypothetical protein [Dehalococcoidales bacterium]